MDRKIDYTISSADAGRDIHEFLRGKGYSRHILASMKPDPTAILVNGRHELMRYPLQEGDVLSIHIADIEPSENIVPAPVPFTIIYEDEDLLVIDKPANTAIHPAISHPANTLANGVVYYYQQQGVPFVFRCINRLDRDTTGLLIVAKNLFSACVLEQALKRREIHRTYLAIAEGILPKSGTIDLPIGRKEGSLIERVVDMEHGDRAVTHYRTLGVYTPQTDSSVCSLPKKELPDKVNSICKSRNAYAAHPEIPDGIFSSHYPEHAYSALQIQLETGRTHQIRVHFTHLGHPLLGDTLYHPDFLRKPEEPAPEGTIIGRQALHSWKLDFQHPITGETMHFEAPVPEDMCRLL